MFYYVPQGSVSWVVKTSGNNSILLNASLPKDMPSNVMSIDLFILVNLNMQGKDDR
jgi:hypothetical protein